VAHSQGWQSSAKNWLTSGEGALAVMCRKDEQCLSSATTLAEKSQWLTKTTMESTLTNGS